MIETATLLQATELELKCARSSDGQTTEARVPGGEVVGTSDGSGVIADSGGGVLLRAKVSFAGAKAGSGRLDVADEAGQALGSVTLGSFRFGPKALKATLIVSDAAGNEVGRFEPQDKKGQDVAILAGGAQVGTLRQTAHDRGLRRSATTYRLELGQAGERVRTLLLATALRHQALLVAARNAGDNR